MAQKITTTTRKFREGVKLSQAEAEVTWESTGHLSVRLLDASGSFPLKKRRLSVDIPEEGKVDLETDDDGELLHPDVPFQDYDLDLDGVKVTVPAVGEKSEVHERHAVAVPIGFVHVVVSDPDGHPLVDERLAVTFPSGKRVEVRTDHSAVLRCEELDPGDGEVSIIHVSGRGVLKAAASPQKIVSLRLERAP